MMIALTIFSVLIITVFTITTETSAFVNDADLDYAVQVEGNRAYFRLAELLRKTGWVTSAGVTYPRVTAGGKELEFMALVDLDGNGFAFDGTNGALEWSPTVFTVRADAATRYLTVFDDKNTPVWTLGRHVEMVSFATYLEDPTLNAKEIRVTILTRQFTREGNPISYTLAESINMRN